MLEAKPTPLDGEFDAHNVDHIGIFGKTRTIRADVELGYGTWRTPDYGIRRAIWDAAFGYVSGFRKRDIAYYVITRSLSRSFCEAVMAWERRREDDQHRRRELSRRTKAELIDWIIQIERAHADAPAATTQLRNRIEHGDEP